jgi:DNA-binding NtrC family response regulator
MEHDPILIVDDERALLESCKLTLEYAGFDAVHVCDDSRKAMDMASAVGPAVAILDVNMPGIGGDELLDMFCQQRPETAVIILTGVYDVETAVELMKRGAVDFLTKPVEANRFVSAVKSAIERTELIRVGDRLAERLLTGAIDRPEAFEGVVTVSRSMRAIFGYVEAIAPTSRAALITGESGTGKELIARAIHAASGRKGAFVAVNAAGLDDQLFSDTLFGHVRGAFSGAEAFRAGLIEQAAGGTLFLDEIGDLSIPNQVKLLRLLQEREYYPLGADLPSHTDARIVVATHRDLATAVTDGSFRQDLYFRLRSHHVHLPPLRERLEDLPALIDHFLSEAAAALGKPKAPPPRELVTLLASHPFPGNIRELEAMIFDAESRRSGSRISLEPYKESIDRSGRSPAPVAGEREAPLMIPEGAFFPTIKEAEEFLLAEALRRADNNQTIAARLLGLSRTALNKRLNRK